VTGPGRSGPDRPEPHGRPSGGAGHVFTLYVASQDPGPGPDDEAATGPVTPLGFLRSGDEGPSGP
jgi:hypothetical protein